MANIGGVIDDSVVDCRIKGAMLIRSNSGTPDTSKQSTDRDDHNSPLMKLVDAALGPNSTAVVKGVALSDNEEMKAQGTQNSDVTSSDDVKPPQLEDDAKVIRGTIHDLVSCQEKKLTFAEFLMQCLNDEANDDVLRWMPCGTQFTITNHRKFTMERMPQLFKIRNMSSFVRKLTRWVSAVSMKRRQVTPTYLNTLTFNATNQSFARGFDV